MINYVPKQGKELSKEEIKKLIDENHVKFIRLQFVDINGMVKNMAVPAKQIDKILNNELMLDVKLQILEMKALTLQFDKQD